MPAADRRFSVSSSPIELAAAKAAEMPVEKIPDDRENLQPDDAVLLIVEDDPHYARVLCDLSRYKGFKVLVATRGAEALALAREYHPTAISLDVFLPDMLGWTVLNHLKQDAATRHIPVQMLTLDEDRQHGLARGAFAFVTKPGTPEGLDAALSRIREYSTPRRKKLLVVEDNPAEQFSIKELLGYDDIDTEIVSTGREALVSTAWCLIYVCPICRALTSSSGSAILHR
jgi:CheY-like chemotaxis protein